MSKKGIGQDEIKQEEKVAATSLLITVFEMHDKENLLNKALDDFLCCYNEEIPEWIQGLYEHFCNSDDNKTQIIKQFAKKHGLKIKDASN